MVKFILTDIEGTTTSVDFVYKTLFPYFIEHLPEAVAEFADDPFVVKCYADLQLWAKEERQQSLNESATTQLFIELTQADVKQTTLKALQGFVWRIGYQRGELKGHIYDDVPKALQNWHQQGIGLGVYSSGSVEAQKLIFGSSIFGDLTPYFSFYFDTQVGAKREVSSYQKINQAVGHPAHDILFLSDVEAELEAAQLAGMKTIHLARPNTPPSVRFTTVPDFSAIDLQSL